MLTRIEKMIKSQIIRRMGTEFRKRKEGDEVGPPLWQWFF